MDSKLVALREMSVAQQVGLYISFELSAKNWLLAISDGGRVSRKSVDAGSEAQLMAVLQWARERFKVGPEARIVSCYEAGRDGFWLHRWLRAHGVENLVVDSSSIEVKRRARHAKTDRLDAVKLLEMLLRHCRGEKRVWSVVRVPTPEQEDQRRLGRERGRLVKECTAHWARLGSLLVLQNIRSMPGGLKKLRPWLEGLEVGALLKAELLRELERLELVERQLREVERASRALPGAAGEKQQRLARLGAVGPVTATNLTLELFSCRQFANRRELAGCVGLAPTPYRSGDMDREQGISKGGITRLRPLLVEFAWGWLRHQPGSELAQWYARRFGTGSKRQRRIGIVALARRLVIALWRYVEDGVIPQGARLKAA